MVDRWWMIDKQRLLTANSRLPTPDCRLPTANSIFNHQLVFYAMAIRASGNMQRKRRQCCIL